MGSWDGVEGWAWWFEYEYEYERESKASFLGQPGAIG
jgi:hypothetical protein